MTLLTLALWLSLLSPIASAEGISSGYSEADYEELVKTISPYISELTEPVTLYNWHAEKSDADLKQNSQDKDAIADVQKFMRKYWDSQLDNKNGGMGSGLYLALDPAATRSYGRGSKQWVLTEVKLGKGLRILDARREGHQQLTEEQMQLLARLGCSMPLHDEPIGRAIIIPKNNYPYPKCAAVIRRLLQDTFKVDGLVYGYTESHFQECDARNPFRQTAFVIMDGSKIAPEDLRIYNRTTTNDLQERIRIQSLLTKARLDIDRFPEAPPATLNSKSEALLWDDLEGKPYDSTLPDWIKKNIFACGKETNFKNVDMREKRNPDSEQDSSKPEIDAPTVPAQ